jgi:NADP-dependent 3-hydroxy acid dehydrogenase YdfG
MSYTLSDARAWNTSLKAKRPEISALFVGATSGIGEHTAKRLAATIERPTIYIVGRNQEAGKRVTEELKNTNPQGTYVFLPADVSQFKNVDEVCQQVQAREKALDLLFLSPGTIAFKKQGKCIS